MKEYVCEKRRFCEVLAGDMAETRGVEAVVDGDKETITFVIRTR